MSESARSAALVVGGSATERERWTGALAEHTRVNADAVADGAAALDRLGPDVEALLIHHDLAEYDAPELLSLIRERKATVRAALLSPAEPTEDIVSQGFDAWLQTPVDRDLLVRTVEGLLACRSYDRAIAALYELATEQAQNGRDQSARQRVVEARDEADAALEAVDPIDRRALLANAPTAFDEDLD